MGRKKIKASCRYCLGRREVADKVKLNSPGEEFRASMEEIGKRLVFSPDDLDDPMVAHLRRGEEYWKEQEPASKVEEELEERKEKRASEEQEVMLSKGGLSVLTDI